jgi:hypothetical protein
LGLRFKIDSAGDVLQPAIAAGDVRREHGLQALTPSWTASLTN